jgi:hypothetical protein
LAVGGPVAERNLPVPGTLAHEFETLLVWAKMKAHEQSADF